MSKVLVIGAGESGIGAAILAKQLDLDVCVSDQGLISPDRKEILQRIQIAFEEGGHAQLCDSDEIDLVIKSPGISPDSPLIQRFVNKEIEVIDEIEFAYRYSDARFIAITGSNGKTTTTKLIYHVLHQAGMNVGLAGNIGFSLARQVAEKEHDLYVVEMSSFQLEGITSFQPEVGLILNITPDHLDRYNYELSNYVDAKFKMIKNIHNGGTCIYNISDSNITNKFDSIDTSDFHDRLIAVDFDVGGDYCIQHAILRYCKLHLLRHLHQHQQWFQHQLVQQSLMFHDIADDSSHMLVSMLEQQFLYLLKVAKTLLKMKSSDVVVVAAMILCVHLLLLIVIESCVGHYFHPLLCFLL